MIKDDRCYELIKKLEKRVDDLEGGDLSDSGQAAGSVPFLCLIGFHRYGQWGEPCDGIALRVQRRTCTKCGIHDERFCGIVTEQNVTHDPLGNQTLPLKRALSK